MNSMAHSVMDLADLTNRFPPRLRDPNKRLLYEIAMQGSPPAGALTYSRWMAAEVPGRIQTRGEFAVVGREDVYDYKPVRAGAVEWHVNFADTNLFVAYGSSLMAQDEIQVAEHPCMASLLEALKKSGQPTRTEEGTEPTPVLVRGAERRLSIATDPNAAEGRPEGLYGNHFYYADEQAVRRAVKLIDPPTRTNLIAIAAPSGGFGTYYKSEVQTVLLTAHTGFAAAVSEGLETTDADTVETVVHTGYWGCGAFGGNRVLMALLQLLAAHVAGVDVVVFHTFDKAGTIAFEEARHRLAPLLSGGASTDAALDAIVAMEFEWGTSDGN